MQSRAKGTRGVSIQKGTRTKNKILTLRGIRYIRVDSRQAVALLQALSPEITINVLKEKFKRLIAVDTGGLLEGGGSGVLLIHNMHISSVCTVRARERTGERGQDPHTLGLQAIVRTQHGASKRTAVKPVQTKV
jgi:hypothetical protein